MAVCEWTIFLGAFTFTLVFQVVVYFLIRSMSSLLPDRDMEKLEEEESVSLHLSKPLATLEEEETCGGRSKIVV